MEKLEFNSPHEWTQFCNYLCKHNRYVLNKKWNTFIETILFTAKKREHVLKDKTILFRARIGSDEREYEDKEGNYNIDVNPLPPKEICAPPSEKAQEGRINPRGISYLYLSNNIETAISEVRPWLRQNVSVGRFILRKDIIIINASKDKHRICLMIDEQNIPSDKSEEFIWGDINYSFSIPVRIGEEHSYYVPTQYLSECFKNAGYGGIAYKSALTKEGYNIVLFDPRVANLKSAQLFDIRSIAYKFEECTNPYFCKEGTT